MGDMVGVAQTLNGLSAVALADGDSIGAHALLSEALDVARELGDKESIGMTLLNLALLSLEEDGEEVDARWVSSALGESLELANKIGNQVWLCSSLEGLAAAERLLGNDAVAVLLFGAAAGLRESIGAPVAPEDQPRHEQILSSLRSALGPSSFDPAWEEGRAMALEQVVAIALGQSG